MEPGTYRVLVVDDEEGIREIVCSVLRQRGNICDQASDGPEALEKLSQGKYDAAVIDFSMPKMNGIVLMREILKSNPDFPVMIMTGFKDAEFEGKPIDEKGSEHDTWDSEAPEFSYATPRAVTIELTIGNSDASRVFKTAVALPVYRDPAGGPV